MVSYEKEMRERAIRSGKGLVTIEVISPGKDGKLGGKISFQGPADADEVKTVTDFLLSQIKARGALPAVQERLKAELAKGQPR